jgi:hypothetical protein
MTIESGPDQQRRTIAMQQTVPADVRQRVIKSFQDLEFLVDLVPQLLDDNQRLGAAVETATREGEELREEVGRLRTENEAFRVERDQTVEAFGRVMHEILRLAQELLQKLPGSAQANGHAAARRSPFERETAPPEEGPVRWPAGERLR